jgi:hypothetical protein
MAKFICTQKCFFDVRLWIPGEVMNVSDGAKAPPAEWFTAEEKYLAEAEPAVEEPRSFAEMERMNAEQLLERNEEFLK